MGFGGGSNQSSTASDSASWATNFLNSMSQGESASRSFIDPTQMGPLKDLWSMAGKQANPAAATRASTGLVGSVMPSMKAALTRTTALTDPTAQIKAQAASLKSGLGDLFRDEINPAIRTDAIASGGFGGGRQGVAEGVATGQLADTFASSYGDIVARANEMALGASGQIGDMASNIYNLGMMPSMAGFAPLQALSGILGDPTVLQEMLSRNVSRSRGGGESRSASTSRGDSSGWDMRVWGPGG